MKLTDLKVLSPDEIERIHHCSLEILEKTGLVIDSPNVLGILEKAGCSVDNPARRARFPRRVVESAIHTVPSTIPVFSRDGKLAVTLGDGGRYCAAGHNAVFVIEDDQGNRRGSTVRDVADFAIVADRLEAVDIIGVPLMPQDTVPQTTLLHAVKAILENTAKPVFFSSESNQINQAVIEMGKAVLGKDSLAGASCLISQLSTTSPLYWEKGAVEALCTVAAEGVPLDFLPQPIAGVTAPYTLAGILTLHNTEVLSGVVIAQLVNPGAPVIYGAAWTTYEMKQANVLIGRPESSLLRIAGAQMAHYYGMPSHTTAPDNDANLPDVQGAWEKMLSTVAGLAGANDLIVNLGMFGTGMTISLEQLIMDHEICRIVKRFVRGIDVSDETIALDTIAAVGPRATFLMEDNTIDNLRSGEHIELDLSNGANFDIWRVRGGKSAVQMARAQAGKLLAAGCKSPLKPEIRQKLDDIIKKVEDLIVC